MTNLTKISTSFLLVFLGIISPYGQDIGVVAKLSPNSGCQLGSNMTVTVQIFNFGTTFTSPFDVSYQIDGNTPVTETVNLGTFNASSSYSHTFATDADLSIPGTYVMKFYTTLTGDGNNINDTITSSIVNDPATVGGTLPADFSVCELSNSGTLNLTGYTGTILDWEITTNGGVTWTGLSNTTDSEDYLNLTQATGYRAVLKSGSCPQDYSSEVHLSIDAESMGGNTSGPGTICPAPNAATITLAGTTGSIVDWEISTDAGITWTGLGDNGNPLNQNNLPQTSSFRAEVQNGACPSVYSDTNEVIVISNLNGGTLDPVLDSVCISGNNGTLTLLSSIGTIDHWESSTDQVTWNSIANTTTSYAYTNLTTTTYYRVIISGCTTDTSTVATVQVNNSSIGGTLTSTLDACQGDNLTNISATGYLGNNFLWETSTDGSTWTSAGTQNSIDFTNISTSQSVRFIAANGACEADTSNVLMINVSSAPSYSSVYFPDSLCITTNSDSVVYSEINGTPTDWVYSEDQGTTWTSMSVSDSSLTITPSVSTTYGLLVTSGTCPIDTFFTDVHVSQISVAGIIPNDTLVCSNQPVLNVANSGSLGNVTWYASATQSGPYTAIGNGSNASISLDQHIYAYATVTNEVCPSVDSDTLSISFHTSNYGIIGDTAVSQNSTANLEAYGGITYAWEANNYMTDLSNPIQAVTLNQTTTFVVQITDDNNCSYADTITIALTDDGLQIATIITPNNDGFNDYWEIRSPDDFGGLKVTVTNAFGQVVYSNDEYTSDWNGDFGGAILPNGAYYYMVETVEQGAYYGTLNILTNE
jgi:gliding motility-associated-like protein